MRFDGLDLNLLVALEALITERSVSLAARKLNLSQPAATGALNRLREYFGDELLVQHGRAMFPTPKAEELVNPVRRALLQIRAEITRAGDFDPASTRRHFLIVASDYAYTIALADVIAEAACSAPQATFEIIPPSSQANERLDRAEIDLFITVEAYGNTAYPMLELWRDDQVIISWTGAGYHRIDAELFSDAGHAVATFGPDRRPSVTDAHIAALGHSRRVEVNLPSFANLCPALVGTRRLAMMHRRYAQYFATLYPITLHDVWEPLPEVVEVAQWHNVRRSDAGIAWLVRRLQDRIARIDGALPAD